MNDKELADKVVELGIIVTDGLLYKFSWEPWGPNHDNTASKAVRDWRVAGALMEKKRGSLESTIALNQIDFIRKDESLPRAIIEAHVGFRYD